MRTTQIRMVVCCAVALIASIIPVKVLIAADTVVTGTNSADVDVKAIQEAVDQGGTVQLKGTFDFGPAGKVLIKNDVTIVGESDENAQPLTKISGGFWTFHSALPVKEPPVPNPGPKVKIERIHFDGATWTPMHFPYTSGVEIVGNRITNVQPFAVPVPWAGGDKLKVMAGARIGLSLAGGEIIPGAATGHIVFSNNNVDLQCASPETIMGQAAFITRTWGATIEIKGNTIKNVSRNSIEALDNYLDEEGRGSVLIAGNDIETPKIGIPFPSPRTPNGIIVGWFLDTTGASDPTRNPKITVIDNHVRVNGETSIGIGSLTDNLAILSNRVEVGGGPKASGILQLGSNAFIARNQITGSGEWALQVLPWQGRKVDGNIFAWNDLTGFSAAVGDCLFMGNKNSFIGPRCKLIDKGKDNLVLTQN